MSVLVKIDKTGKHCVHVFLIELFDVRKFKLVLDLPSMLLRI